MILERPRYPDFKNRVKIYPNKFFKIPIFITMAIRICTKFLFYILNLLNKVNIIINYLKN